MSRLEAQDLTCGIGNRTIVRGISLVCAPGTMTAIVGVNGVGKSTLMRVLAGVRRPICGQVTVDDTNLASLSPRQRARRLAFVAQEETIPDELTLSEMVTLGRLPHQAPWQVGGRRERAIVAEALAAVGLTGLANRSCAHLSGGERRRALLAKGLAQGTDLLLLDEPTNHLDVHHQIHLLTTMRATGRTIIATIHDLDLAMGWFDQVVMLADGAILASGAPLDTMTPQHLEDSFRVRSRQIVSGDHDVDHLVIDGLITADPQGNPTQEGKHE